MTLDKDDLKALGTLIDERLDVKLEPIDLRLRSVEKDVKTVKQDVKQIKKDLNGALRYVDEQDSELKRQIKLLVS